MIPHEREMVKRLKDQPFTLLGINSDQSRSALQKILKEQEITWAQIYDGQTSKGPIANKWNVHGWPTIYVLDHEGVIRHRDLRDLALEKAVDELLEKVPGADARPAIQKPPAKGESDEEQTKRAAAQRSQKAVAEAKTAVLHTSAGDITFRLRTDAAPLSVKAFKKYAQAGWYDGIAFLEATKLAIYAGASLADGTVKQHSLTGDVPDYRPHGKGEGNLAFERGSVGTRAYLTGPEPVDSHEFFICLGTPPARPDSNVFAEVVQGLDILDRIAESADESGHPKLIVTIKTVELK